MHTCLAETIGLYDARALVFLSFTYKNIYAYQHPVTCMCYITTASIKKFANQNKDYSSWLGTIRNIHRKLFWIEGNLLIGYFELNREWRRIVHMTICIEFILIRIIHSNQQDQYRCLNVIFILHTMILPPINFSKIII